jgi:hypothetical protein
MKPRPIVRPRIFFDFERGESSVSLWTEFIDIVWLWTPACQYLP